MVENNVKYLLLKIVKKWIYLLATEKSILPTFKPLLPTTKKFPPPEFI